MFFIPLNQIESVELVIHALRAAGGAADCTTCPASRVCMKQCLAIAGAVQKMLEGGNLPLVGEESEPPPAGPEPETPPPAGGSPKGRLTVVK